MKSDYERALIAAQRYIAYAGRSEDEVRRRLQRSGFDLEVIENVLERLAQSAWTDDKRLAQDWVESRFRSRGYGRRRLTEELRRKGIASESIAEATGSISDSDEIERALSLVKSKWPELDIGDRHWQRQIMSFLQRRGYEWEIIEQVIGELVSNNTS
ncbi:MAG: RecX family transcriptional regulator [Armatimonadetes bacterium]|nr:RecX family transcriptional regulator [Armatimonadota bacterium]